MNEENELCKGIRLKFGDGNSGVRDAGNS
jgi:hypothetical protein